MSNQLDFSKELIGSRPLVIGGTRGIGAEGRGDGALLWRGLARGRRPTKFAPPRRQGSQFRRVAHFAQVERLVRSYLLSCVSAGATQRKESTHP
jgi:hypothetical protein